MLGQLAVDAVAGAVVGGVSTVDGDPPFRQAQQHAALDRLGGETLHGAEENRMVGDDQLGPAIGALVGDVLREREARHHPRDVLRLVAPQKADVVPRLGQIERGQRMQKVDDVGDRKRSCGVRIDGAHYEESLGTAGRSGSVAGGPAEGAFRPQSRQRTGERGDVRPPARSSYFPNSRRP